MSKFSAAVEKNLAGIEHLSTGYIPHEDCSDCPEQQNEAVGDEGFFSWRACDGCGSSLGGTRYAAHGRDKKGGIIHLDICVDCLMYMANGDEPENWQAA